MSKKLIKTGIVGLAGIFLAFCPRISGCTVLAKPLESFPSAPATFLKQPFPKQQLFNPKFANFDQQPRGCDVRGINGWFYWYRHGVGSCTVVPSSNQADATFKAVELADSTEVSEAGIGYRLLGDPFY